MKRRGFLASLLALPAAVAAASKAPVAAPIVAPIVEPVVEAVEVAADNHPWTTICYSVSVSDLDAIQFTGYNRDRMGRFLERKR